MNTIASSRLKNLPTCRPFGLGRSCCRYCCISCSAPSHGQYAGARSFCEKMIERFDVSAGEVADVHVIAHGRAVGRVVIGSKELKKWSLSLRRRDDERDEVGLGGVVLSDLPIGIGPGSIEVAQIYVPQAVSPLGPIQGVFHD